MAGLTGIWDWDVIGVYEDLPWTLQIHSGMSRRTMAPFSAEQGTGWPRKVTSYVNEPSATFTPLFVTYR
jgi:hypothetical protein